MTVAQALNTAVKKLGASTDSPRLDAEVLLSHVVHRDRAWLLAHDDRVLASKDAQRFIRLLGQRASRVPIPYLTGSVNFFGLPLRVTPAVLVPRPFTELLIEKLLVVLQSADDRQVIADIGTGSGAIAVSLAKHLPNARILGSDVSTSALRVARANAKGLRLNRPIIWRQGSLLKPFGRPPEPTVIVANLPYLSGRQLRAPSIRREPKLALDGGADGLGLIGTLLTQAATRPTIRIIALEFDPPQYKKILRLLKNWSPRVRSFPVSDGKKIRGLIAEKH